MTLIYSHFSATTIAQIKALPRPQDRDISQYTLLPWKLEDLPGTTWRNVWTFSSYTVQKIQENNWGKLGPDPEDLAGVLFSIGLWRGDRFCIEHWVRVDHLLPKNQLDWAIERVAHCQKQLTTVKRQKDKKRQSKRYQHSPYHYKLEVSWKRTNLSQAREELSTLSQALAIPLPIHLLNVGAQPRQQLVLF